MDNIKRLTYLTVREKLNDAAVHLSSILRLEANGLTMAEAGNISLMVTTQLHSLDKKIMAIGITLDSE